jgi:ABC-type amino acid transport substrate-binding protein
VSPEEEKTLKHRFRLGLFGVLLLVIASFPANVAAQGRTYPNPSLPNFACSDGSYAQVVKNGITLGISPDSPYTYLDPSTKKPTGIDWDINTAVLSYIGVTKINYALMPFESLIPALQSRRIDVIADNIHETPARDKVITFTSPAWWYGPALLVPTGNPAHITSYADLKKSSVSVGTITGSAADEYLASIGVKPVSFQDNTSEFLSLVQKRVNVVLEDITKYAAFKKQNPSAPIEVLNVPAPAILISTYGYSYARYGLRKSDCTLNFAYTRALAELRGNGVIGAILAKWGLTDTDLYLPGI